MRYRISLKWWLSGILLVIPLLVYSQSNDAIMIKATLNYNFAKYTQWPDSAGRNDVNLCYFNPAYQRGFDKLAGKTIDNKKLVLIQVATVDEVAGCQLIYIDSKQQHQLPSLFSYLRNKPVLTVSDMTGFIDDGGMIEIVSKNNKLHFKVNLAQLQQQGLTLSSQVLKLAIQVKRDK